MEEQLILVFQRAWGPHERVSHNWNQCHRSDKSRIADSPCKMHFVLPPDRVKSLFLFFFFHGKDMVSSIMMPSSWNSSSDAKVVCLVDEMIPVTNQTDEMYKLIANIPVISFVSFQTCVWLWHSITFVYKNLVKTEFCLDNLSCFLV